MADWKTELARELPCVAAVLLLARWFLKSRDGTDNRIYRLLRRGLRVEDTSRTDDGDERED